MIKLKNINHSFNSNTSVIKNFSLVIKKGECIGLTGPSGCGKSTLAHIVAGHIAPSAGEVIINGKDITGRPSRDVFLITQESDLFPWQTVKRHITFTLNSKNDQHAHELLSLVKLTGYENYYPSQLSGGMKKRLSLARALAINPKLLVLDESFGSLDSNLKYILYAELKEIWEKTNTTILLITHDSSDLQNLAQREIKLNCHE